MTVLFIKNVKIGSHFYFSGEKYDLGAAAEATQIAAGTAIAYPGTNTANAGTVPTTTLTVAQLTSQYPPATYVGWQAYTTDQGLMFSNGAIWIITSNFSNTPFLFGAKGDGVADDTVAVQACVNSGNYCTLPPNTNFKVTASIQIPVGGTLIGCGKTSVITGSGITGGVVQVGYHGSGFYRQCLISNFSIGGTATNALRTENMVSSAVSDIWLASTGFTDAFLFTLTFGCSINNLVTDPYASSHSCFYCDGSFSANACNNWYSGTASGTPYGAYFQADLNFGTSSQGNTFNALTVQGCVKGLYLGGGFNNNTFNGFYSEVISGGYAIILGAYSGSKITYGNTFNNPVIAGTLVLDNVETTTINSPLFALSNSIDLAAPLTFSGGGGGTGAWAIARVSQTGTISSVLLLAGGTGFSSNPTVTVGGAGTGATVTAVAAGNTVTSITLTGAGSGYATANSIIPVIYGQAMKCVIKNPTLYYSVLGNLYPNALWPWVVRGAGAPTGFGVTVENDVDYQPAGTYGVSPAMMIKVPTGDDKYYIITRNTSGVEVQRAYTPPSYPYP